VLVLFVSAAKATAKPEVLRSTLRDEVATAWDQYKRGALRQIFSREDRQGAVVLFECENIDAAKALVSELPLVQKDLIEFQLIPLSPFVGFELLFAPPQPLAQAS
jgi:hypothetical protein